MANPFIQALSFLIQIAFDFYLFIILFRFLLQVVRADFYNPICQFVVKLTNPVLIPLRRVIPGFAGLDMAALVVLFVLGITKLWLLFFLQTNLYPQILGLMIWTLGDLLGLTINIYFYAIIFMVIASWIPSPAMIGILSVVHQITGPVMNPFRRLIPPMSGFDLTPIIAIIALKLTEILVVDPISLTGRIMAASR